MNKGKKTGWILLAVVFLLIAGGLIAYLLIHSGVGGPVEASAAPETESQGKMPEPSFTPPATAPAAAVEPEGTVEAEEASNAESAAEPAEDTQNADYVSPVNFEACWAVNEDVIGWLYIPGIRLSYPIMMDPADNTYYLTHDAERNETSSGAIFIEDYNHPDFQDMCTVVYGHRMYDGDMFGVLQASYSSLENLTQNQDVMVYLPDREIHYQVFAAVPYDNSHILYYNDFDDQLSYREFIYSVYSTTGVDATLVPELEPTYGDRLLILSTCLWGDKTQRYLVLAKELTD